MVGMQMVDVTTCVLLHVLQLVWATVVHAILDIDLTRIRGNAQVSESMIFWRIVIFHIPICDSTLTFRIFTMYSLYSA